MAEITDFQYYTGKAKECAAAAIKYRLEDQPKPASAYEQAAASFEQAAASIGTEDFSYYQEQAWSAEERALAF